VIVRPRAASSTLWWEIEAQTFAAIVTTTTIAIAIAEYYVIVVADAVTENFDAWLQKC
jgi:hypothetical protein